MPKMNREFLYLSVDDHWHDAYETDETRYVDKITI
tara:strand:+ start:557 stop:661 length:105 start_codon:yes stop_codon:yes gene_type:complete